MGSSKEVSERDLDILERWVLEGRISQGQRRPRESVGLLTPTERKEFYQDSFTRAFIGNISTLYGWFGKKHPLRSRVRDCVKTYCLGILRFRRCEMLYPLSDDGKLRQAECIDIVGETSAGHLVAIQMGAHGITENQERNLLHFHSRNPEHSCYVFVYDRKRCNLSRVYFNQ
mgnify:CR=1 FL=1